MSGEKKNHKVLMRLLTVVLLLSVAGPGRTQAAIPQSAVDDPLYQLGYLVITHYQGVNPDGSGDSGPGIQQAIYDAFNNNLVLYFPEGVYQVSDVLKCYYWSYWDPARGQAYNPPGRSKAHVLVGSQNGVSRPLIRLAASATGFDDPGKPRPVIAWHYFSAINEDGITSVEPADPLTGAPPNFMDQPNVIFGWSIRNIDIDCSNHPGAVGGVFSGAQYSGICDVRINATGAYCGFYGIPGRNSFTANIEVEGGKYGLIDKGSIAGAVLVNARFYNQTEYAFTSEDFCPLSVVGFHIRTSSPKAIFIGDYTWWSTGNGTMTLVDGKIEMLNGGFAVDNPGGRSVYLENVYVKGADYLIKNGASPAVNGSADWKRMTEYSYNNQTTESGTKYFNTFSLINGLISNQAEPVKNIETVQPGNDLLERHSWDSLPFYEGEEDGTVNPRKSPFNAKGDGVTDDWNALQSAINSADDGKVFLPKGTYIISKPLVLKPNTIFLGADQKSSVLKSNYLWTGGSSGFMIESADDSSGTAFLGFIGFEDEASSSSNITAGYIHWRTGKNSMIMMTRHDKTWGSYYGTLPRYNYCFSEMAGGRHFITPHQEEAADNPGTRQVYINNTTQPLTFYGLNVECTKTRTTNPNIDDLGTNVEISNSCNIRIHSMKREGRSPSIIIKSSNNVAVYGMGRLNATVTSGLGGYNQITGQSSNILMAVLVLDNKSDTEGFQMLTESLTGQNTVKIDWPDNVSIYKRGALSDIYTTPPVSAINDDQDNNPGGISIFPNPCSVSMAINFTIPATGEVSILINDIAGIPVKKISKTIFPAGENQITWNLTDARGNKCKSGVYLIRVSSAGDTQTGKFIVM